jgi:hypothetical protein
LSKPPKPPRHATHESWDFCARVFTEIWDQSPRREPSRTVVNIQPLARELQRWLRQEPAELVLIRPSAHTISNPYSQHASFLIAIFSLVVNDFYQFLQGSSANLAAPYEIDLRRMRYTSEMILYAVRIFEALLKQLLYCTQFDRSRYEKAALGQLLSSRCEDCWRKRRVIHKVSLAGSLAHRYRLCGQYEQCLRKDLHQLNALRNAQAAHALVGPMDISPSQVVARGIGQAHFTWIGEKVAHMLTHIAELDEAMIIDAQTRLGTETRTGPYNSNLVSTYYWQIELIRLYRLLVARASMLGCQGRRSG